ncbi:MAG TPA: bifunctional glutamate N-acetyltransferase/amino-acid acetyltransferase ArgJ [Gammaproteobacteria bacterium]|nr:bifunctional glutamate N-acetyltransferase/amino-acid acetyltransferase ArgJ [Gammaproteobacteria bacterium]
MAVGLKQLPLLHPVNGLRLGTSCAGIKHPGRRDLVVMEMGEGTHCVAAFTQNAFCAAPVRVARDHLAQAAPQFLLINTGNANAGTGAQGMADARVCCAALAQLAKCEASRVLPFSTGVIGEPLPVEKIKAGLAAAYENLNAAGWEDAAHGIMTTDTMPKGASRRLELNGDTITVTGIAKGAGMIRPDMATMLAFIATDAGVSQALLQQCLDAALPLSFNRITVDGDTSTNDACVLIATGHSGLHIDTTMHPAYAALAEAITQVCAELAQAIVRDGEGATKFITVKINGGNSEQECTAAAYAIAHSPLVKTAFFACDPNWGRILAALGRAGIADLNIDAVTIHLDELCIVCNGGRAPDYQEQLGQQVMRREEISIRVDLARGPAHTTVWTCDFSYDYVRINAEYRS